MQAFGQRKFERRLGVDRALLFLARAHAAGDDVHIGVLRLDGHREGKAHFNAATTAVGRAHQERCQRDSLRAHPVFAAHQIGLGTLQRDRLQGIGKIQSRRERRTARDALRQLHSFARALASVFRITEFYLIGAREGVRHAVHRDLFADNALRPHGKRRPNAALATFLVGVGGEVDFGNVHFHLCAAAGLCRIGRDVDTEGNEPFKGDEIFPAQSKNTEEHFPFRLELARPARYRSDMYRLCVL